MTSLSIKDQEKVLYKLIELCRTSPSGNLFRPSNFERNFNFVSANDLILILEILQDKEYIKVMYADLPDNFNINVLSVTPKGLNYRPQKILTVKERWCERFYGFAVGTVFGSVSAYFVTKILDRILGL